MVGRCLANKELKVKPIKNWVKSTAKDYEVIQYIGIAIDEPERLERIHKYADRTSLLEKYRITEKEAYSLCEKNGLLSPIYKSVCRGGCWFCPSARVEQFLYVRQNHPWLWNELREMSKTPNLIRSDLKFNMSFEEVERRMDMKEWEQKNTLKFKF